MEKLEKVIAGLECCTDEERDCKDCPYDCGEMGCMDDLMREARGVLSGIRGYLECEIRISNERQNDKISPMYDGVCVGNEEATKLRYNHIRFCEHILKIKK